MWSAFRKHKASKLKEDRRPEYHIKGRFQGKLKMSLKLHIKLFLQINGGSE
jgi:hypothetical protein